MYKFTDAIARLGARVISFYSQLGAIFILLWQTNKGIRFLWKDRKIFMTQMLQVGVRSLPLVGFIALFTGAVAAWQAVYQLTGLVSLDVVGAASSTAIFIELGPVLAALVFAGRVGSSIAAELGVMQVTEQMDALESLAVDPVRYLAVPRFFSCLIMAPVLTIYADAIALIGSFFVATYLLGITTYTFWNSVQNAFELRNVLGGLLKSHFFGASIAIIGCHVGFQTKGGAQGVGITTIRAFVLSAAAILVLDYIITMIVY